MLRRFTQVIAAVVLACAVCQSTEMTAMEPISGRIAAATPQGFVWEAFTSANDVADLVEDPYASALWVATDGGLVLWDLDSDTYVKYTVPDGLSDNHLESLALDHAIGTLWIGTNRGVTSLDRAGRWSRFDDVPLLGEAQVNAVAVRRETGDVWVGSNWGAFRIAPDRSVEHFGRADGLATDMIWSVAVDPDTGDVWFGTLTGASRMAADGRITTAALPPGCPGGAIDAIAFGPAAGEIWFGIETSVTGGGDTGRVCHQAPDQSTTVYDGFAGGWMELTYDIEVDRASDSVWIAVYGDPPVVRRGADGGFAPVLVHGDPRRLATAIEVVDEPDDVVEPTHRLAEATASVWFGTIRRSVMRFGADGLWTDYATADTDLLSDNFVQAVAVDSHTGEVWVGTRLEDVAVLGIDRSVRHIAGLNAGDIALDSRSGDRWFATSPGAVRIAADDTQTRFTTADGLPGDKVELVAVDPRTGDVWFATDAGVARRDALGDWRAYTVVDHPQFDRHITTMVVDPDTSVVWFGFNGGGLFALSPDGRWTSYPQFDSSSTNNDVTALAKVPQTGHLWIGTRQEGLYHLDGNGRTVHHYLSEDGLPNNHITSVAVDPPTGDVWFASYWAGVSRLSPSGQFVTFGQIDGIADIIVNDIAIDPANRDFWFGTGGGLARLGPVRPTEWLHLPIAVRAAVVGARP